MARTHVAAFSNPEDAGATVRELREHGVPDAQLGVWAPDSGPVRELMEEGPTAADSGAKVGAAVGAGLFGLAAVALAGPIGMIAAGPLAAGVGGAGAGAVSGGALGGLIGLGIPEKEALMRQKQIADGGVVVALAAIDDEDEDRARREVLSRRGPVDTFDV